jgi:hypothetical protein
MDSTTQTTPTDSKIINELVSHVTHGFDIYSPNNFRVSEIINELLERVTHGLDNPNSP